jgi:hypothetical protein
MIDWLIYSGLTSFIPKGYVDYKKHEQPTERPIIKPETKEILCPSRWAVLLQGMRAPLFTFKQKKETKTKNQHNPFHVQIIIPVGCQIFRRYVESKNTFRLV